MLRKNTLIRHKIGTENIREISNNPQIGGIHMYKVAGVAAVIEASSTLLLLISLLFVCFMYVYKLAIYCNTILL